MVPLCGIDPESIAALIFDLFAKTSAWVVNAPPEFVVPAAWQVMLIEHEVVSIGCTSAANFGLMPTHENVVPPPPDPPPVLLSLLLQAKNTTGKKRIRFTAIVFFINHKFKLLIFFKRLFSK
jgi:hypothetical protein